MKVNIGRYVSQKRLKKNPDAQRKIEVHLDPWDTWDLFTTLSYIILPALKQFRQDVHGAGFVDDEDVPDNLKRCNAPPVEREYDTDEFWFERWHYVIDEMIWAFDEAIKDEDYKILEPKEMEEYYNRKSNGLRLFGKYFFSLWT